MIINCNFYMSFCDTHQTRSWKYHWHHGNWIGFFVIGRSKDDYTCGGMHPVYDVSQSVFQLGNAVDLDCSVKQVLNARVQSYRNSTMQEFNIFDDHVIITWQIMHEGIIAHHDASRCRWSTQPQWPKCLWCAGDWFYWQVMPRSFRILSISWVWENILANVSKMICRMKFLARKIWNHCTTIFFLSRVPAIRLFVGDRIRNGKNATIIWHAMLFSHRSKKDIDQCLIDEIPGEQSVDGPWHLEL